jgi:hypothetical protein
MNGTEALAESASAHPGGPLGEASTELQWPLDRVPIRSEEPQVRSLPAIQARRLRARPAALVLMAGLGFGALGATLVLGAHRGATAAATDLAPPPATTLLQTAPARLAAPLVVAPPPVTASAETTPAPLASAPVPPAEAADSAAPRASASSSPSAPLSSAAVLVSPATHTKPAPTKARPRPAPAPQYAPDRPGPGF